MNCSSLVTMTLVALGASAGIASADQSGVLRQPVPDRVVVLSFDDAVSTQSTIVAPLLKQYGFKATFYICEFPPDFATDKHQYMTWEQIKALQKMGFEIGNHTLTHANVAKLSKEKLQEELGAMERKCKELGIPKPTTFAYPGYGTSPAALAPLAEQGYLFARTGGDRPYHPDVDNPLLLPSYTTNAANKQRIMDAFKQARDGGIVVLTIHGVPDYAHPWVNTPPELFKEYLQYLHDNRYTVIAMRDLARYVDPVKALARANAAAK